jgi:hypothetical protein
VSFGRTLPSCVLALVAACLGCAHRSTVERAYGGDVVEGHYVSPQAYAAFLRGAIAEAEGHAVDALSAYGEAADFDPASPEPWTRMAQVRCSQGGRDGVAKAESELAHALKLDPGYARAWAVKAACAAARGDVVGQRAAATRAAQLDPQGDGASILLARAGDAGGASIASRQVLVALTVTAMDPVAAWTAMASWAEAHGDVALWTRALIELAHAAPERRDAIARSAEELAGAGSLGEARSVAGAAIDANVSPLPIRLGLAARLAVDEAILRRDGAAVRRRAARAGLPLDEAAGRALLGGERAIARQLASGAAAGDPGAFGARLVLAVVDGADLGAALASQRPGDAPASGAALVALGVALTRGALPAGVRASLGTAPRLPLVPGDDRVVRPAVELVSRGALPTDALPPDGVLELAVIRGAPAPSAHPAQDDARLDLRHRYLALAFTQPSSPAARELGERLRGVITSDAIVACAAALVQLSSGASLAPDAAHALLARNPADPLLAAITLRLAEKVGDTDVARHARETLGQLGLPRRSVD